MSTFSIGQLKNTESPRRRVAPEQETHRVAHGSTAWAVTTAADINLHQPQDGVVAQRRRVTDIASRLRKVVGEPDDARLTGGTRSLMRRLSGLNIGLSKGLNAVKTVRRVLPIQPQSTRNPQLTGANIA
jgi:hypothetical protein